MNPFPRRHGRYSNIYIILYYIIPVQYVSRTFCSFTKMKTFDARSTHTHTHTLCPTRLYISNIVIAICVLSVKGLFGHIRTTRLVGDDDEFS